MPLIDDFITDEEESPDTTPGVAQAPRPIIAPPSVDLSPQQQSLDFPGYVRQPVAAPQFWQDEYRGGPSASELSRATSMSPYGLYVTPKGQLEPRIAFDPSKGLAPLSKLALTPEEAEAGMEWVASHAPTLIPGPALTPEERTQLRRGEIVPSTEAKTLSGVTQGAYRTAESLTSPMNLGLMVGTAGLSEIPVAARALSGAFAADMARQVPEMARNLGEAVESKDPEAIARAATELAATGAFTTMAGKHAVGPRVVLPETMRELAKEPSTTGAPNAIRERSTEAPNGRLPEQPIENAQLPAEKGVGEVPPGGVPPRDTTGAPRTEETRPSEIPLKPEEVTIKARTPAGEEIGLKMEAGEAQRRLTQRKTVLEALRDCLG